MLRPRRATRRAVPAHRVLSFSFLSAYWRFRGPAPRTARRIQCGSARRMAAPNRCPPPPPPTTPRARGCAPGLWCCRRGWSRSSQMGASMRRRRGCRRMECANAGCRRSAWLCLHPIIGVACLLAGWRGLFAPVWSRPPCPPCCSTTPCACWAACSTSVRRSGRSTLPPSSWASASRPSSRHSTRSPLRPASLSPPSGWPHCNSSPLQARCSAPFSWVSSSSSASILGSAPSSPASRWPPRWRWRPRGSSCGTGCGRRAVTPAWPPLRNGLQRVGVLSR
mmetsp:Transcript_33702/g.107450  ORF Transcript_33702/g.107450 Transcript_33702/m.107450 type:complete len:279 (+) Transcript_33702:877-1713(+)